MSVSRTVFSMGPPVPELPVADVERAQRHYRDVLGFEIGWREGRRILGPCRAIRP